LIFEVNNSFHERKIVFLRFKGATKKPEYQAILDTSAHTADGIHFHHSESKHPRYMKLWKKDLFISPFNDVDGDFTTEVSDPCLPGLSADDAFYSNITLISPNGRRKMNGEVRSLNDPIDPLNECGLSFAWFLARWACISTLSISRIHFQALLAFVKAPLKYYQKPEPRPTNLPRQASEMERSVQMQIFQRSYPDRMGYSTLTSGCKGPSSSIFDFFWAAFLLDHVGQSR
jgi:hypothetical protein